MTRRRIASAAVIASIVLIALAAVIAALPAQGGQYEGRVGIGTHVLLNPAGDPEVELRRIRDGGVDWVREDFRWDAIEPEEGRFVWDRTDAFMAAAAREQIDVLAILTYSSRWASSDPSGGGDIHYPPRDPADYARFARMVVDRYGRDGAFWRIRRDLPKRPLGAVELWNEPWGHWYWKPDPDPAAYARLAYAGARAVQDARQDVRVLISADPLAIRADSSGVPWFDRVLAAEPRLGRLADAYSLHPYPSPANRGPRDTSMPAAYRFDRTELTRRTAAARDAERPLWITEIGWTTAEGSERGVSEETQARYVRDAVADAITRQGVEKVFVFGWDRSSGRPGDGEGNLGLQRADGTFKPAWSALVGLLE